MLCADADNSTSEGFGSSTCVYSLNGEAFPFSDVISIRTRQQSKAELIIRVAQQQARSDHEMEIPKGRRLQHLCTQHLCNVVVCLPCRGCGGCVLSVARTAAAGAPSWVPLPCSSCVLLGRAGRGVRGAPCCLPRWSMSTEKRQNSQANTTGGGGWLRPRSAAAHSPAPSRRQ